MRKRLLPNKPFPVREARPPTSERVFSSARMQAWVQAWVQGAAAAPDNPYNRRMWQKLFRDKGEKDLAQAFEEEVAQARRAIEAQAFPTGSRAALLEGMRRHLSGLDGLLVLRGDRYGNEFLQPSAERLRFFSGFSGSNGWAILDLRAGKKSLVASDARYRLQLRAECDATLFETREAPLQQIAPTLLDMFGGLSGRIGYDPWQVSERLLSTIKQQLRAATSNALRLVPVSTRRIDALWQGLWQGKPPAPLSLLSLRTKRETGESPQQRQKRIVERIFERMRNLASNEQGETLLLTRSDAVAWALCLRASDLPFLPVALGFAMLDLKDSKRSLQRRVQFFSNPRPSLTSEELSHIEMRSEESLAAALDEQAKRGQPLLLDSESVPSALVRACRRRKIPLRFAEEPTQALRLCKTPRERANMRRAHLWDGIAWVRFFAWLARAGARKEAVCEHTAACKLQALRQQSGKLLDESFKTISASGARGAMIHYPTPSKNAPLLKLGEPYLIDSGGQYAEGTTDLTRTLIYGGGSGTEAFRQAYTAVLRGHIALATIHFPEGTQASALDTLARRALWQLGLDYPHATGHGVGFCLGVHEGSVRISQPSTGVSPGVSPGASQSQPPLQTGMILSNEPGFYLPRRFGIRIENLLEVVDAGKKNSKKNSGGKRMLAFHTLSLAPIACAPILLTHMESWERNWLNAYHARLRETIAPHLKEAFELAFLKQATQPLL